MIHPVPDKGSGVFTESFNADAKSDQYYMTEVSIRYSILGVYKIGIPCFATYPTNPSILQML